MNFNLPDLPYERNALEPYISLETINYHYGKHHQAYVNNLNRSWRIPIKWENIRRNNNEFRRPTFNNAAQVWNHTFYWNCLSPVKTNVSGTFLKVIENNFGTLDKMIENLQQSAVALFGSGWTWLV
jgi:Fe-Mn family superoxide dismutase